MMLALPDVTVVVIDNAAHALSRMALEDTLNRIRPHATIIFSDNMAIVPEQPPGGSVVQFYAMKPAGQAGITDAFNLLWGTVPRIVTTSHYLVQQWDSWVLNPEMWTDSYLEYDYIGAPWLFHATNQVGNGGFSLRSARLGRYLADHPDVFPMAHRFEDQALCRDYRGALELIGFKWAPTPLAARFAWEHGRPGNFTPFGFHDVRNFPWIMTDEEIAARLAHASPYVLTKGTFLQEMRDGIPQIRELQGMNADLKYSPDPPPEGAVPSDVILGEIPAIE